MVLGRKAAALIVTALMALTVFTGACKVPEDPSVNPDEPQPKERTRDHEVDDSRVAIGMSVPHTDNIAFDIFGTQDHDNPAIVHLTVYPVLKPEILADHQDGRIMIELQVPYGVQIEAGKFRHRASLRNINKQKINTDLRIITAGPHTVRVVGTVLGPGGELIVAGDSPYRFKNLTDGTIDFSQDEPETEAGSTAPDQTQPDTEHVPGEGIGNLIEP